VSANPEVRVAVDANVLCRGFLSRSILIPARGVLILAAAKAFTLVLLQPVKDEVERALAREAAAIFPLYERWLKQCRVEIWPDPTEEQIRAAVPFRPFLRHGNDVPVLVGALAARPDYFVSDNTEHFAPALATATGLNILTTKRFLRRVVVMVRA
jgi:hypothetical protein